MDYYRMKNIQALLDAKRSQLPTNDGPAVGGSEGDPVASGISLAARRSAESC